jgi:glycosyltransferase involved in cell wall biosynthesis
MSSPVLSVCLITYNHEKYIEQAIESILKQEVNFSWNLIIADDCSTDRTRVIIADYESRYPDLIKLILQEKNVGAAQNWIDLISHPSSKYIAYLEGDDYWIDNRKLQKQIDFLEKNPNFSLCFCHTKIKDELTGEFSESSFALNSINLSFNDFLKGNPAGTSTCTSVFRREFVDNLNWFLDKPIGDQFLWAKLTRNNKAIILPFYGGVYRQHPNGEWGKLSEKKAFEKKIEVLDILRKEYYHHYKSRVIINLQKLKLKLEKKINENNVRFSDIFMFVIAHKYQLLYMYKSRSTIIKAFESWRFKNLNESKSK